jgi:segregation and condensation protein A
VATITHQYLEYLELMQSLNIELAGEFLVMAATLLQIKSRLLLPGAAAEEEEGPDPRLELALPLADYLRYKEAGRWLSGRPWLGRDVYGRGLNDDVEPAGQEERPLFNLSLFDLLDAFRLIMARAAKAGAMTVRMEAVSVSDRMAQLMERFRGETNLLFTELFSDDRSPAQVVVTFLAVLELARLGFISVYQERAFGPIILASRPEAFEVGDELG